jgi:hypothetical protein
MAPIQILSSGIEQIGTGATSLEQGEPVTMFAKVEYTQRFGDPVTDTAKFYVDSEKVGSEEFTVEPPSQSRGCERVTFSTSFRQQGSHTLRINIPKSSNGTSVSENVYVTTFSSSDEEFNQSRNVLQDERDPVTIAVEQPEENAEELKLGKYKQPDISLDSGTKFSTHDVIGGPTVRQKTGEEPREMTINGVCTEDTASKIHDLSRSNLFSITSSTKSFDFAQLTSASTEPFDKGGAMDLDGAQIYTYTLNFVEVSVRRT